jgi:OCT family organic cation transporter-like MFS transporter 4/5
LNNVIFLISDCNADRFQGEYFGEYMPMTLFGVAALLAAALTMTLPESKNIKLPDTIDEAERIGNEDKLEV